MLSEKKHRMHRLIRVLIGYLMIFGGNDPFGFGINSKAGAAPIPVMVSTETKIKCVTNEQCPESQFCFHAVGSCSQCQELDFCHKLKRRASNKDCVETHQDCGTCLAGYVENESHNCESANSSGAASHPDKTNKTFPGASPPLSSPPPSIALFPIVMVVLAMPFGFVCLMYVKEKYQKWKDRTFEIQPGTEILLQPYSQSSVPRCEEQYSGCEYSTQEPYYSPKSNSKVAVIDATTQQKLATASMQQAIPFELGNFGSDYQGSGVSPTTPPPTAPDQEDIMENASDDDADQEVENANINTNTEAASMNLETQDDSSPVRSLVPVSSNNSVATSTPASRNSSDSGNPIDLQFEIQFFLQARMNNPSFQNSPDDSPVNMDSIVDLQALDDHQPFLPHPFQHHADENQLGVQQDPEIHVVPELEISAGTDSGMEMEDNLYDIENEDEIM